MKRLAVSPGIVTATALALGVAALALLPGGDAAAVGRPRGDVDRQVAQYLAELFAMPGPPGEILDRALASPAPAGTTPEGRSAWLTTLARALGCAGRREDAGRVLRAALEMSGPNDPGRADTLEELARLQVLGADFQAARKAYRQVLTLLTRRWGATHPRVAGCLTSLGELEARLDDPDAAAALTARAVRILARRAGADPVALARAERAHGMVLIQEGRQGAGELFLARALARLERARGAFDTEVAATLISRGRLAWAIGQLDAAEQAFARAREIVERRHVAPQAAAFASLALVSLSAGDPATARRLFTEALELHLGRTNDPLLGTALHYQGAVALVRGQPERARELLREGLAIRRRALGAHHPDIADGLVQLGELHRSLGELERAEELFARALALRERVLGSGHSLVAESLATLADLYIAESRYEEAAPLYERAWTIREGGALVWPADS